MHLSDGVLNLPTIAATSVAAGGLLVYGVKKIKEEEIPKISLMTAAFFTFSLISIPVGPSSIHPLLGGLLGIVLGKRSTIAVFIGLLLQAVFFQHGGLTTLGANTLLVAVPALISYRTFFLFRKSKLSIYVYSGLVGGLAVVLSTLLLVILLFFSNAAYNQGFLSVINILVIGHIPLLIIETFLTAFAVTFIYRIKPNFLKASLFSLKE